MVLVYPNPHEKQPSDGAGRDNAHRERLWISPHCVREATLFDREEP